MRLELLGLLDFSEDPQERSTGLRRSLRGVKRQPAGPTGEQLERSGDSGVTYPFSIQHLGRTGGIYHFYAETAQMRAEWKQKLEEAIGERLVVLQMSKVSI